VNGQIAQSVISHHTKMLGISWKEHRTNISIYQYINIRRDWSGKGVNGEGGSDEMKLQYFLSSTSTFLLSLSFGVMS